MHPVSCLLCQRKSRLAIQSVTHHPVSARTIRRRLQQSGLSARRSLLRLPLTQNHRRLRRQWCDERRMWTAEWNEIVFTDESRFCLQHHNGRVWRHRGERMLDSCVMHRHTGLAPGIVVWGGIGYHSRTPLVRIAGTSNSQLYISEVLEPVVLLYLQGLPTAIFQQDNAQPHVARIVQRFFVNRQIELLLWPARSLDLSPIENMWSMVAQRLTQITSPVPHQINFGNVWKLLGLLYPKNTSKKKASLILRSQAVRISPQRKTGIQSSEDGGVENNRNLHLVRPSGINFKVLETNENQLRDVNSQIMNLMLEDETITPHDLEKEQDMVVQYEKNFIRTELRVAEYLQLEENEHQGRSNLDPARSAQEGMPSCKLPKMALPVFDGTCLEWMGWWSRFEMIHESARSALAGYGGDELELPITIDQRLERLLEFLRREVKGDQRLEYMKEGFGESSQRRNYGQHIARMHAAQITEAQGRVTPLCLRLTKRMDEIRKVNACFRCLRVGHVMAACRTQIRCSHCKGLHHTTLHLPRRVSMEDRDQKERQNTEEPRVSPGEQEIALSGMHVRTAIPTALLATARVRLVGPRGVGVTVRALLDQGSQSSFVHRDLLHHLTIPVHKVNAQIFGINDTRGEHVKQMVSFSVASLTESGWTIPIRALVVGRMTGILPSRDLGIPVPSSWKTLPLADPQFETSGRVDVILGADNTRLGWIVSGKLPGEGEVGPHRVYNIRVNYEENLDNVLRRFWEVEEVPLRHAKSEGDEYCEELYKTRGRAKMERHEKRSRTPASRTGEKISEYSMSKEEYPTSRVKLTESKDGYGSERVKGKVDKLCPASAMVKVTERKTCPDSSVLKRPEESTCPDCSKVKGSMCPHCAKMREIEMLTCTDSAKVKSELCPDSSKVRVDKEKPCPDSSKVSDIKPKDYDRLEEKESDRRIISIDELSEELLESYKEFPPIHVKVDKCGNLDEHWLRRKIREDLCQTTNVLGDLQTNVVNLDIVEELLKSRPKCENRESELDIYENLDLEQRILDIVQESNIENPNCEEKMADSKLVQSHVEICRGDEEPDDRSMSISRYVAQHVSTASCCGYLQNGREPEMQDIYDDAKISKEAAKKEKVEQPHEISLSCQLLLMDGNLNSNTTVGCLEKPLDNQTSESVCCNDLDTEICPLFEDSIGEDLHNFLQPKVEPPRQESIRDLLTENDDIPEAIDENHEEDSSILETTFVIRDEEPNEAIGTPGIEISEVSVIDKSEGKDSKEPMVSAEALDKKELCHDDPAHLNVVEADLNRPKEATSGIINVSTEANESASKAVPVEIVDPSTKDYLQSCERAKLFSWKPIDSLCLEDFKESENDDEKYSSSAYMEWPEILKKEVFRPEALEKAVNLEDSKKAAEGQQLSEEHLEESNKQGSCIRADSGLCGILLNPT
ncbi:hypothetical protein LAZ67_2005247 [Cordylochernes scorpioides]|uniref:Tc1-like transposase DDE domain-containing protein n=1 Tax=Cordylochernes scorpioides TaxID=51811 RepID=A0ABY6K7G3_9ARAC|nr:hypothetical protein LAZ67_2005247 [Cordylochernes scorpioides]